MPYLERLLQNNYQLTNNFDVSVLDKGLVFDTLLKGLVKSVSVGETKIESTTLTTGQQILEKITYNDTLDISFHETVDNNVYNYFDIWFSLNYDKKTRRFIAFPSVEAKRVAEAWRIIDLKLNTYDLGFGYEITSKIFRFYDCQPKLAHSAFELDYETSEPMENTISFAFQDFEILPIIF